MELILPPESDPATAYRPPKADLQAGMQKIVASFAQLGSLLSGADPDFKWRGGPKALYTLAPSIVEDIAIRIERDKERFRHFHGSVNPSDEKVGSLFAYWIAKRRPIVFMERNTHPLTREEFFLNEYLAIYTAINRVVSSDIQEMNAPLRQKTISAQLHKILRTWRYTMAYRNFSSDDIAMILKLCFT